jgi:hypothetical protein
MILQIKRGRQPSTRPEPRRLPVVVGARLSAKKCNGTPAMMIRYVAHDLVAYNAVGRLVPVRGHATLHSVINAERGTKPARSSRSQFVGITRHLWRPERESQVRARSLSWPCCDRKLPSGEILVLAQPGERATGTGIV